MTSSNEMWLKFVSDSPGYNLTEVQHHGFQATYTTTAAANVPGKVVERYKEKLLYCTCTAVRKMRFLYILDLANHVLKILSEKLLPSTFCNQTLYINNEC